jgi:hypothetical protein
MIPLDKGITTYKAAIQAPLLSITGVQILAFHLLLNAFFSSVFLFHFMDTNKLGKTGPDLIVRILKCIPRKEKYFKLWSFFSK